MGASCGEGLNQASLVFPTTVLYALREHYIRSREPRINSPSQVGKEVHMCVNWDTFLDLFPVFVEAGISATVRTRTSTRTSNTASA